MWDLNDRFESLVEVGTSFGARAVAFEAKSMITPGESRRRGLQVHRMGDLSESASRA
jgi:hypothetical protein